MVPAPKGPILSAGTNIKTTQILQLSGGGLSHVLEPLNVISHYKKEGEQHLQGMLIVFNMGSKSSSEQRCSIRSA